MKSLLFAILMTFASNFIYSGSLIQAQEPIVWLNNYTQEMLIGSSSYTYSFLSIESNICKIRIEENLVNKKGIHTKKAYVFYLSDVDLAGLSFKTSGSGVIVTIGILNSQKFITEYSQEELNGYTASIEIHMNDLDKARSFIDAMKLNCEDCKTTDRTWNSRQEALAWLTENIGESAAGTVIYKQQFSAGEKDYLVKLENQSTSSKGEVQQISYDFNLSDINPQKVNLIVSGKNLKIELPVKGDNYFIRLREEENEYSFAKGLEIYSGDIEQARNIVTAIVYLAFETKAPERESWSSYESALQFVEKNLGEVKVGSAMLKQSLKFVNSPSGKLSFISYETDSKGVSTEKISSFYLSNIQQGIEMDAGAKNILLNLVVKEKSKYIQVFQGDAIQAYTYALKIYGSDLENLRELNHALEYALANSENGIVDFDTSEQAIGWLLENVGEQVKGSETIQQSMDISVKDENRIALKVETSSEGKATVKELYQFYPEDIVPENLEISISGSSLSVPVSTGKLKYISLSTNEAAQNFTTKTGILFDDVQRAQNFIEAIKLLYEKSHVKDRRFASQEEAWAFLQAHIGTIKMDGSMLDQKVEMRDDDACKLNYTSIEEDSKGTTIENKYVATIQDFNAAGSQILVSGKTIQIEFITKNKEKLIQASKNGEAGKYTYSIRLGVYNILVAKKVLAAFSSIIENCD